MILKSKVTILACSVAAVGLTFGQEVLPDRDPAWSEAHKKPPMTAQETRAFMRRLADYVFENHLKRDETSPQRGMVYEYFHVARKGQFDQYIQGEALDTMHDGAWFAVAMVNAFRATGDPFYKEVLVTWQLPFYLKMLNHSDELFCSEPNDGRPGDDRGWRGSKEWLLQGREKGFVPYWWDDGCSVSLEMTGRKDKDEHVNFAGHNELKAHPNPQKRLSGYSHGSSNHLAQDLAVMIQQAWLLLRESDDPVERALAGGLAEAARNLRECRARHGSPAIPAVLAACATAGGDAAARAALPEETWASLQTARSDYRRAFFEFKPDQPITIPGFADDQQYRYYVALAKRGAPVPPVAFRLAYDALTLPKLYQAYSDDAHVPPGINVFDLHPVRFVNGRPADTRSQRKGPSGRPRPVGSRFGPQNLIVCGWALQALRAQPDLWDTARREIAVSNYFPVASGEEVRAALARELGGGLRTWEAVLSAKGFIPTGLGAGNCGAGFAWDELSDAGGYAHLISAAAQWLLYLEGRSDWTEHRVPAAPGVRTLIKAGKHEGIVLDGDLAEWKSVAFTAVTPATGVFDAEPARTESSDDLSFRFAVCHDAEALYVAVEVTDDVIRVDGCPEGVVSCAAWDADAVEVFIDGNRNRAPDSRVADGSELKYGGEFALVANGAANSDYSGYPKTFGKAGTWQGATNWRAVQAGAKKVCYEFRITWAMMGGQVKPGDTVGFTLSAQDNDSGHRNHALYWCGNPQRPYVDERGFGDVVLFKE